MTAASPAPAATLPPSVPRMFKTTIDPEKVGRVIGLTLTLTLNLTLTLSLTLRWVGSSA